MSYELRDSVIKSRSGRIKFRINERGASLYHIGVWLATASDEERDAVDRVDYVLHHTFNPPDRFSNNRANDFSITFWAWGAFEIVATVSFVEVDREALTILHQLRPHLPKEKNGNYEQVD